MPKLTIFVFIVLNFPVQSSASDAAYSHQNKITQHHQALIDEQRRVSSIIEELSRKRAPSFSRRTISKSKWSSPPASFVTSTFSAVRTRFNWGPHPPRSDCVDYTLSFDHTLPTYLSDFGTFTSSIAYLGYSIDLNRTPPSKDMKTVQQIRYCKPK